LHGITPGGLAVVGNSMGDTVWASDFARGLVLRIDGNARRVVHRIRVSARPTRIAATESAVWVVTRGRAGALWRIDPAKNAVVARIPLGLIPKRVVLADGAVWVTGNLRSSRGRETRGVVLRVDPDTNRIDARIPLGDVAADGLVVSHGLL